MSTCTLRRSRPVDNFGWVTLAYTPLLTLDEERDVFARVDQGDIQARDHAIRANLRLVVCIAKQFAGRGVPFDDLVSSGNLGLIKAVESYDPHRNHKFSTFASYWIKQSIRIGIHAHRNASHLPSHARVVGRKWQRKERELTESLGREPTHAEIAQALGLTKKKAAVAVKAIDAWNANDRVQRFEGHDEESFATIDRSPEDRMIESETMERLVEHLYCLDEREAAVVRMRFGLDSAAPMTLREVGDTMGLTRERIRQIEAQALGKLRAAVRNESDDDTAW